MLFELKRKIKYIGLKNTILYFIYQRLLRINSHVPWPCHPASNVSFPERIKMHYWRPYPGFLPGQYIQAINGVEIGTNVRLGPGVKIISASHSLADYSRHEQSGPVKIGNNCWLGAGAIILPGVEINDHTIVAAGAVVNKSFKEKNIILGGVPARIIKEIGPYEGNQELY